MYNGWKNRQTWNVALWLSNVESIYHAARALALPGTKREAAARLRDYAAHLWPNGATPDGDSLRGVDWTAVAESMREQ